MERGPGLAWPAFSHNSGHAVDGYAARQVRGRAKRLADKARSSFVLQPAHTVCVRGGLGCSAAFNTLVLFAAQLGNEAARPITAGNHPSTDSLTQYFDSKLVLVDSASSTHGRHITGNDESCSRQQ